MLRRLLSEAWDLVDEKSKRKLKDLTHDIAPLLHQKISLFDSNLSSSILSHLSQQIGPLIQTDILDPYKSMVFDSYGAAISSPALDGVSQAVAPLTSALVDIQGKIDPFIISAERVMKDLISVKGAAGSLLEDGIPVKSNEDNHIDFLTGEKTKKRNRNLPLIMDILFL